MVIFVFWGSAPRILTMTGDVTAGGRWQAVGIPFRAGKDAFFCLEPPREHLPSKLNLTTKNRNI